MNRLEDIEEWGKLLMTQQETADALGIGLKEFSENKEYMQAYTDGRLTTIAGHKKKIIALANQGSGPAQTHLEKLRKEGDQEKIINAWR